MAPHRLVLLVLLSLIVLFDMSMAKFLFAPQKPSIIQLRHYQVKIHNDLEMYLLDSHCFLKDNDLGLHILFPGEQQDWSFEDNIFETTKFRCRLEWENGLLEFDSFKSDLDFLNNFCGNLTCSWSAKQDGVYLTNAKGEYVFQDYWDMLIH
ncbi:hypothetical protein IC575_024876 [Cucumis melo]